MRRRGGGPRPAPASAQSLVLGVILTVFCGCATSHFGPESSVRPAVDVPDRFLVYAPDGSATIAPAPGEGCRNPMVDPRDGAQLRLVRSAGDRGDYEAPAGRYGLEDGDLLRLDCATGRALGVMRR